MPISVENAFATGVSSEARALPAWRAASSLRAMRPVDRRAGRVADRARRAGQRTHGQQHAPHIRVRDDRRRSVGACPALAALARIGMGLLRRALRDRHALQADRETRIVHHREHAVEPAVFLADQPAGRAAIVAVHHRAGRRAVNAELVLDRMAARIVARADRAVVVDEEFRHQEQRDAFRAGRRIGQAREHEMDDVVGQIMLAIGDEDLRAGDAIRAVGGALGAGAQRADIRARLRLGELHRAHPFAGGELLEIFLLQRVGAVLVERLDRPHGQHRTDAERHRGRIPHLDAGGVERVRQPLPAPRRPGPRARSSRPAPRPYRPPSSPAAW